MPKKFIQDLRNRQVSKNYQTKQIALTGDQKKATKNESDYKRLVA